MSDILKKLEKLLADPNGRNELRGRAEEISMKVKQSAEERERADRIRTMIEEREAKARARLVPLPHNATAQEDGRAGSCEASPERQAFADHVKAGGVKKIKRDGEVVRYSHSEAREVEKALTEDTEWKDRAATLELDYI